MSKIWNLELNIAEGWHPLQYVYYSQTILRKLN